MQIAKSGYSDRNKPMIPFYHDGGKTATKDNDACIFKKRIGNTVYHVNVHYSRTSKETINDKITRLVKNDVSEMGVNQDGYKKYFR